MSLNTAHLNNGVLIHSGECILLYSDGVSMEWSGQDDPSFKGTKSGRIYLTTHRVIFNNKHGNDPMQSFSFPFVTLSEIDIEQPVFGANYVKGKVRAQPNGNWIGEAKFKMTFKRGGAIEFGQALLRAAHLATQGVPFEAPPPYMPPGDQWYAAPPPAYAPAPQGYYGWMPPTNTFPDQPPNGAVFMTDGPPPYPGLNAGVAGGAAPPPPQYGGYPPQQGQYPTLGPQGGYPAPPPQYGAYPPGGYPQQSGAGYPPQQSGAGYPPQQPGAGYPPQGAMGFQQPPPPPFNPSGGKAAEAAQSAYYDPNRPQMAYVPPPAYYENPPSYNQATDKKNQ